MRTGWDTVAGMVQPRPVATPIISDGLGRVEIRPPTNEAWGYVFTPEDTAAIARASSEATAVGDKAVLLIGGPKHSETVPLHPGRSYKFPRCAPIAVRLPAFEQPPSFAPHEVDEYCDTGRVQWVPSINKFCHVFEHSDLAKANIKKRAAELDGLIARRSNAVTDARVFSELAANALREKQASLQEAVQERNILASEHGV